MEVIHLSGYINEEKMAIAKQYLIPKSLDRSGLKKSQIRYSKSTLSAIADHYAREAGVRNLRRPLTAFIGRSLRRLSWKSMHCRFR